MARATLGVEEELHLVDEESLTLSARAPQLLSRLPEQNYGAELQRTTIETNTEVVDTLDDLRTEILRLRAGLIEAADAEGLAVAAVGTPPSGSFGDMTLTSTGRFGRMQEQYRLLVDEQLICGTQFHVGVDDRDIAVEVAQRIAGDLPVLLAMSASSPFLDGHDTGYASMRTVIWGRWPSAGGLGPVGSAAEYDQLLDDLIDTGVIADTKMAYFDVRPSAHAPTLELRVCDACPIVDDAVLLAGLFRALVSQTSADVSAGRPWHRHPPPIHRAATWQAARNGLSGNIIDLTGRPAARPAVDVVSDLVERLAPALDEAGDLEQVRELTTALFERGNSTDRQRAAFAERGRIEDVVQLAVDETRGPASGIAPTTEAFTGYRVRAGDEAVGLGGWVRPSYEGILERVRSSSVDEVRTMLTDRDRWLADHGVEFVVGQTSQPFMVDLLPRILPAHSWRELTAGLVQRARALESFLRDVYGEQRIVADGVIGDDLVTGSPGWREEGRSLPADCVRAGVMGFDLVRDEFRTWHVLEDNVRNPSGMAYAMAARELMDRVAPQLPRPPGLLNPAGAPSMLRNALLTHAPSGAGALLSSGPGTGAWYEHQRLASEAGLLLVTIEQLVVEDHHVRLVDGGRHIGALYLRLDHDLVELPGGKAILDAAARGNVSLTNTPGTGVADDKALYRYVPELIEYYLDESPLSNSVPTYRTGDEVERRIVIERVGELVTKPVDGYGGHDVLIGPHASAPEVAARRRAIAQRPTAWVAQEVVPLSSHPTFEDVLLMPRHVDLRLFALVTGTGEADVTIAPVGLTRVAGPGSLVVNSSQGGGAKDTWIVTEEE